MTFQLYLRRKLGKWGGRHATDRRLLSNKAIDPITYQIKNTEGDRKGSQPEEDPFAEFAKAIGLLMLGRPFVNALAVLIFDPNRVSAFPLVLGHLKRTFEVADLSSDCPSRHIAPFVT